MNSVTLIGRLTASPAVHAGEKHQTCTFRIAVGHPNSDGADFVDIVAFDKLGAVCADWLTKGREIAVVGKLRLSEWTGRDGDRRSKIQVIADSVNAADAVTGVRAGQRAAGQNHDDVLTLLRDAGPDGAEVHTQLIRLLPLQDHRRVRPRRDPRPDRHQSR